MSACKLFCKQFADMPFVLSFAYDALKFWNDFANGVFSATSLFSFRKAYTPRLLLFIFHCFLCGADCLYVKIVNSVLFL